MDQLDPPKHLLLHQWLGWEPPQLAHTPLIRNTDWSKLGKRKCPWAKLTWFRDQGYLPEALLNFLTLLGQPPVHEGDDVQTMDEFVAAFDWSRINPAGAVFDLKKLDWLDVHQVPVHRRPHRSCGRSGGRRIRRSRYAGSG